MEKTMTTRSRALRALLAAFALPLAAAAQDKPLGLTQQDYFEIQQLNARYVYAVDECTNGGYDYADLYADDGTFGISAAWGKPGRVYSRGREALAGAGGGDGKGGCRPPAPPTSPFHGLRHVVSSLVITPTATGARGRSTLLTVGIGGDPTAIEWQGGYEDVYVKTPRGWRIQSRLHVWIDMEKSVQYKAMVGAGIKLSATPDAAQ
jgi:hypothetical protein